MMDDLLNAAKLELTGLGREFLAWVNANADTVDDNGPNERQIAELAEFAVRLIRIVKTV
jgi:hypothetical protein